jgi:glycosyltransferase involved in cell wall biosynthesis/peptidoglycan/xylan/chitin deacetylase (PgdA/CDA1 family)/ubiquinone/menaquinone biosynthesis C-methylase UbiE
MATISVVIPAYNREVTLRRTLDALLAQTYGDWAAIVVDDGSTDGTAAIAAEYAGSDQRFRPIHQENAGVSAARNHGLAAAASPWLFFLDADDWISAEAFELLIAASDREPGADLVHGGCVRVLPNGTELPERPLPADEDLFLLFARTCAFSIHTCIVRTELAKAVGGFDESLTTCEDWDLWQRIARTHPVVARIPEYIAYYRIRPESASRVGRQIIKDAVRVVERGHGDDPRMNGYPGKLHRGERRDRLSAARLYVTAYAAGMMLATGQDARPLLDEVPDGAPGDIEGAALADTLFYAILAGRAQVPAAWASLPPEINPLLMSFIEAMAEKVADNWMVFTATEALEQLILENTAGDGDRRRIAHTELVRLDPKEPLDHIVVPEEVRRVVLDLHRNGTRVGTTVLPAVDGVISSLVASDALAEEFGWDLLQDFFARTIYRELEIGRDGSEITVRRAGTTLAGTELMEGETIASAIHRAVGWVVFLQELWGLPGWTVQHFYGYRRQRSLPRRARTLDPRDGPLEVEIAEELPRIVGVADRAIVSVRLAGVRLMSVRIRPARGRISPRELREAITQLGGYELCQMAIREALLPDSWPDDIPIRHRLRELARARSSDAPAGKESPQLLARLVPPGRRALLIGRHRASRIGTPASRVAPFPIAAGEAMRDAAASQGQPVAEFGDGPALDMGIYVPFLFEPNQVALEPKPVSQGLAQEFDELFADAEDPWDYTSAYERRKYDDTMSLIPEAVDLALEVGSAEGLFTEQLAHRARRLIAIDISQVALDRAARRCAQVDNVELLRLDAFSSRLPSNADLIVCSEMLYYARDRGQLKRAIRNLATALRVGGTLVTTHATAVVDDASAPGFDWDIPFGAAGIQRALLEDGRFALRRELQTPMYWAQRYERVAPRRLRARSSNPAPERLTSVEVPHLTPEVAEHFRPQGGPVRTGGEETGVTTRLPILMYHRIADDSSPSTRRWTATPSEFEEQLAYLREAGYRSATIEEWAAAGAENRPLSGKRVLITFDDGFTDFADAAVPLLQRHGFRAELFVVPGHVGGTNSWEPVLSERYPLMDWPTLQALPRRVVTIGSHTVNHRMLTAIPAADAMEELVRSKVMLEDRLSRPVTSMAYPYGPADGAIQRLVGAAGYEYGYTTLEWCAYLGRDLLKLPRLEVRGPMPIEDFGQLVGGGS